MASYSSEAADQVVRIALEGTETAVKLAGSGAKEAAAIIYAVLKDERKTKGRTRLVNMLRSGKELRIFAVMDGDMRRFCEQAKRYGVLYTVLKDRSADDGVTDVMIKREDAAKVSRIFDRFSLARVDTAAVRAELEKNGERPGKDPFLSAQEKADEFVDGILEKDPARGMAVPSLRSMPSSARRSDTEKGGNELFIKDKPSVKKQLDEIRKMLRGKSGKRERQITRNIQSKGDRA